MLNKLFEKKLINEAFENDIPKLKMENAAQLYLNNDIEIKEKSSSSVLFKLKGMNILIKSDIGMSYYINDKKTKKDEYVLACLLAYKRNYFADNDIKFNLNDFIVENNYYNNTYITFFNVDEYKLRISFYIGLINYLYKLDMKKECLQYLVDFYMILHFNITFDNRYQDLRYKYKYQVIKNKADFIIDNHEEIINLFKMKTSDIVALTDCIYTTVVNYPLVLKNSKCLDLYEYILKNYNSRIKHTQRYNDIVLQNKIAKWYLGKESDDILIDNIDKYEARYCYVKYLSENQKYQEICDLFKNNSFNIPNQEINYLITQAYYICNDLDGAVNIFNRFNNISYDRYISYKEKFPLMFEGEYLDKIITYIIDNYNNDEINKILSEQKLEKYEVVVLARENFELLDIKFDQFLGKYDDLLIRVYQKEIINICNQIRGRYNYIPEELLKKFEKLRKIKNGKYYLLETIKYIEENYYVNYRKDLDKYISLLGV